MTSAAVSSNWRIDQHAAQTLADGRPHDPFAVLGPHDTPQGRVIRAFLPGALEVDVVRRSDGAALASLHRLCQKVFSKA